MFNAGLASGIGAAAFPFSYFNSAGCDCNFGCDYHLGSSPSCLAGTSNFVSLAQAFSSFFLNPHLIWQFAHVRSVEFLSLTIIAVLLGTV